MERMEWLADVLRDDGLMVVEHPGWKTRGKVGMRPRVVIGHHTASHWTTSDSAITSVLVNGRPDLPGPLSQLGLTRQGVYICVAAGKANHAGKGSWMDANESLEAIGIEAYNYGNWLPSPSREAWPQVQLDAYDRGVAALLRHIKRNEKHYCGHREWAIPNDLDWKPGQIYWGRKPDPSGIDLPAMRERIRNLLEDHMAFTPEEEAVLKAVAPYGLVLADLARALVSPGPVTGKKGSGESLLWLLETHRVVSDTEPKTNAVDPIAMAARLLGQ